MVSTIDVIEKSLVCKQQLLNKKHNEQVAAFNARHQRKIQTLKLFQSYVKTKRELVSEHSADTEHKLLESLASLKKKLKWQVDDQDNKQAENKGIAALFEDVIKRDIVVCQAANESLTQKVKEITVKIADMMEEADINRVNVLDCLEKLHTKMISQLKMVEKSARSYWELGKVESNSVKKEMKLMEKMSQKGKTLESKTYRRMTKASEIRSQQHKQTTKARNSYLLDLQAINAQENHFFYVSLNQLIDTFELSYVEKFKDLLKIYSEAITLPTVQFCEEWLTLLSDSFPLYRYSVENESDVIKGIAGEAFEPLEPLEFETWEENTYTKIDARTNKEELQEQKLEIQRQIYLEDDGINHSMNTLQILENNSETDESVKAILRFAPGIIPSSRSRKGSRVVGIPSRSNSVSKKANIVNEDIGKKESTGNDDILTRKFSSALRDGTEQQQQQQQQQEPQADNPNKETEPTSSSVTYVQDGEELDEPTIEESTKHSHIVDRKINLCTRLFALSFLLPQSAAIDASLQQANNVNNDENDDDTFRHSLAAPNQSKKDVNGVKKAKSVGSVNITKLSNFFRSNNNDIDKFENMDMSGPIGPVHPFNPDGSMDNTKRENTELCSNSETEISELHEANQEKRMSTSKSSPAVSKLVDSKTAIESAGTSTENKKTPLIKKNSGPKLGNLVEPEYEDIDAIVAKFQGLSFPVKTKKFPDPVDSPVNSSKIESKKDEIKRKKEEKLLMKKQKVDDEKEKAFQELSALNAKIHSKAPPPAPPTSVSLPTDSKFDDVKVMGENNSKETSSKTKTDLSVVQTGKTEDNYDTVDDIKPSLPSSLPPDSNYDTADDIKPSLPSSPPPDSNSVKKTAWVPLTVLKATGEFPGGGFEESDSSINERPNSVPDKERVSKPKASPRPRSTFANSNDKL